MVDMKGPMMSSKRDDYSTPQELFDNIDEVFHFTLDAAADASNTKCENYYTVDDDALTLDWPGTVWVNPPYGKYVTPKWVKKGYEESAKHNSTVCMLLPARTDTIWFHDIILKHAITIFFIKGRLTFTGEKDPAPFPSMIVFFNGENCEHEPLVFSVDREGNILP